MVTITSDASYMYVLICRYCFLADNLEISICCHLVQGEFRAKNTRILYLLRSIYLHPNITKFKLKRSILEICAYQLRIYKSWSAFYSYNFHIFRLFGFGKEEGDVYRFLITMCFCHYHQPCVMYVLSYVSVVVDFLQTIIWKSLFAPFVQGEFRA